VSCRLSRLLPPALYFCEVFPIAAPLSVAIEAALDLDATVDPDIDPDLDGEGVAVVAAPVGSEGVVALALNGAAAVDFEGVVDLSVFSAAAEADEAVDLDIVFAADAAVGATDPDRDLEWLAPFTHPDDVAASAAQEGQWRAGMGLRR